jgi:CheY-like chemotaxis protein/HPt (histidine-containing phosphotransfer) domain-containing protein
VDTGIGISADNIERLFQPYNQLRADIARSYGGTGLGLSITKNLVELMGGSLTVTSEIGRGSCFTVTLALASDSGSLCKAQAQPVSTDISWQKPDRAVAEAHQAVVLCAEDNGINREVLVRVLDRLGINHDMAEDGQAALALLDRSRHGLLLTDAQMPELDGWQLTECIRHIEATQDLARLPIVMLTANALSESDSRVSRIGIDAVLTKPLNIAQLEATLLGAVKALGDLRRGFAPPVPCQEAPSPPILSPDADMDLTVLADLVGDDPDTIAALLDDFLASVNAEYAAIKPDDAISLAKRAHTIKGASRYAGAKHLAEICQLIETRAKAGDTAHLRQDLENLDAAVASLPDDIAAAMAMWRTKAGAEVSI